MFVLRFPSVCLGRMAHAGSTGGFAACAALLLVGYPAVAQDDVGDEDDTVSRAIVQALPSADIIALNHALKRLSINPKNLEALVNAGNAAMALGDNEAAIGFFGRADEIDNNNPQVKLGLATIYMQSQRPQQALRYFAEAERAGIPPNTVAPDRGLAFDLVGRNSEAQEIYKRALGIGDDKETVRRLALSYAIAGDREAFNTTLRPLIMERDVAAFRARAFGLAILGDMNEARGIVKTVIPRDLASRIIPYLEFMPRLTGAQQAAAANLGIFPKAAEIGRDDPAIIAFRAEYAARSDQGTSGSTDRTMLQAAAPVAPRFDSSTEQHWVQVASGRNRQSLQGDWDRVKRRAPQLLAAYRPHVVEAGGIHRLLAGPVTTQGEAKDLSEALAKRRVESFSLKSTPGAKIEELQ